MLHCDQVGNRSTTSAMNSKANKMPTIEIVRLAVMKWLLRLLEPATAIAPDARSSIPRTCRLYVSENYTGFLS